MPPRRRARAALLLSLAALSATFSLGVLQAAPDESDLFETAVRPILESRCVRCHREGKARGKLALDTADSMLTGGREGPAVVPGNPDASPLIAAVSGDDPEMPKTGPALSAEEVESLRRWIAAGARVPEGSRLEDRPADSTDHWSLAPLVQRDPPQGSRRAAARGAIDRFLIDRLRRADLKPSPPATRRVLVRRIYFDLIGLPPSPAAVEEFLDDEEPEAVEKLVDRLLASPRYGERQARHWLDLVHYADTHGYDKDKLRPNAWPYRDYVVRAFNVDKPFERFVLEQVAGDQFWPETTDGITALGFLSAGPWDFIGHVEVPESKLDGQVARNLDRDDMVSTTIGTFTSTTVQCARCHDHKFDRVTQRDYYGLQSVFAAIDRADRPYEPDASTGRRRRELEATLARLSSELRDLDSEVRRLAGPEAARLDERLAALDEKKPSGQSGGGGYHSAIEPRDDVVKWVQVDLGKAVEIRRLEWIACDIDFAGIGPGFGYPRRFRIEASDDSKFEKGVQVLLDQSDADTTNPGTRPQSLGIAPTTARFVRFTATRLALRQGDYIFALAELRVLGEDGIDWTTTARVESLDSIEAPPTWRRSNLIDGWWTGASEEAWQRSRAALREQWKLRVADRVPAAWLERRQRIETELSAARSDLTRLPDAPVVYCGTVHRGSGNFAGTGAQGGQPRPIHVLQRGDIARKGEPARPRTFQVFAEEEGALELPAEHDEGDRRRALAEWLVRDDHPLTWRSIVNRVWQWRFGQALVATPNDFGQMGERPSHPELLDWLALRFRDRTGSIKSLSREIVLSDAYRQSSAHRDEAARVDSSNRLLWRQNRRRLDAEPLRDAMLQLAGRLRLEMNGPGFQDFVIEKPEHSPHYEYHLHDARDPRALRRTIWRFIVRSQQQPFLETLDCADPAQRVARRQETLTALQALVLLNDRFMLQCMEWTAERLRKRVGSDSTENWTASEWQAAIDTLSREALTRSLSPQESADLIELGRAHGLEQVARVVTNLNEFLFVD